MAPGLNVIISSDDPERRYSPAEEAKLTENLVVLLNGVHGGAFSHLPVDATLLRALHFNIFTGVRSHAGRFRSADSGTEHLTFGPHRSCHRGEVDAKLRAVLESAAREITRLERDPAADDYESDALNVAVRVHADVIWIHPFEDGNGRTCRALMSCVLVRLGLRPISIDAPREEYIAALNHFYTTGDFQPMADLAVGLYMIEDDTDDWLL